MTKTEKITDDGQKSFSWGIETYYMQIVTVTPFCLCKCFVVTLSEKRRNSWGSFLAVLNIRSFVTLCFYSEQLHGERRVIG